MWERNRWTKIVMVGISTGTLYYGMKRLSKVLNENPEIDDNKPYLKAIFFTNNSCEKHETVYESKVKPIFVS